MATATVMIKLLLQNWYRILIGAGIGLSVTFLVMFIVVLIAEATHYQYTDLSLAWTQMLCLMVGAYCGGIVGYTTRRV